MFGVNMKNLKKLGLVVIVTAVAMAVLFVSSTASAGVAGKEADVCRILDKDGKANMKNKDGIDILDALQLANKTYQNDSCKKGIYFTKPNKTTFELTEPLLISPTTSSSKQPFVFDGASNTNGGDPVTLNTASITDMLGDKCAITVKGSSFVFIRNIILTGNAMTDVGGICVEDNASVILENVKISGFDGAGIVLNTKGTVAILPDVKVSNSTQAIRFEGDNEQPKLRIFATNSQFDVVDENGLVTNANSFINSNMSMLYPFLNNEYVDEESAIYGLDLTQYALVKCQGIGKDNWTKYKCHQFVEVDDISQLIAGTGNYSGIIKDGDLNPTLGEEINSVLVWGKNAFIEKIQKAGFSYESISGIGKKTGASFIESNSDGVIRISKIDPQHSLGIHIKGDVANISQNEVPTEYDSKSDFCKASAITGLSTVHILKDENGTAKYYGSVGLKSETSKGGIKDPTNTKRSEFEVYLPAKDFKNAKVVLMAEIGGDASVMATSPRIAIDKYSSTSSEKLPIQCAALGGKTGYDSDIDDGTGTGTGSTGSGGAVLGQMNFGGSVSRCLAESEGTGFVSSLDDENFDTDNDGVPDAVEMRMLKSKIPAAGPASYNSEDLSGDGYACDCSQTVTCWVSKDSDNDGIPDGREMNAIGEGNYLLPNSDFNSPNGKDNLPDVMDGDSDGDGVSDYKEDRPRIFRTMSKGYLYDDVQAPQVPFQINGKPVSCELKFAGQFTTGASADQVGVVYGLFAVSQTAEGEGASRFVSDPSSSNLVAGETLMRLQCRNPYVLSAQAFNGQYDVGSDFSNWRDAASKTTNMNQCQSGEILASMGNFAADANGNGLPDSLENAKNEDGTWNYQMISDICISDIDDDKIPDCVERWVSDCPSDASVSGVWSEKTWFSPYTDDTDSDGVKDMHDVCPFTKGANDSYSKNKPLSDYSCDPSKVFENHPLKIVTCFIDRDRDGLVDCLEDKNLDGRIDRVSGEAGIDETESDPINEDTDGDGLLDGQEYKYNGATRTNRNDIDTDKDGLTDGEEMGGNASYVPNARTKESSLFGEGKGCMKSATKANFTELYGTTNPLNADTDGDGLGDGTEVMIGTNPNNWDSDNDGIADGMEDKDGTGVWPVFENGVPSMTNSKDGLTLLSSYRNTNPCNRDTDGDGLWDNDPREKFQCVLSPDLGCQPDSKKMGGLDSDSDGLEDIFEAKFGTDPFNADSDQDNLTDGEELHWHIKNNKWTSNTFLPQYRETDPNQCAVDETMEGSYTIGTVAGVDVYYRADMVGGNAIGVQSACKIQVSLGCGADSDGDGMPDFAEVKYGTNPANIDSDEDGIIDGIETGWLVAEKDTEGNIKFRPQVGQYEYVPSTNVTNALDSDTDDDGLVDGFADMINFEDVNCNGKIDLDTNGRAMETNPRNANSDGDAQGNDFEEALKTGQFDATRAYSFGKGGCGNVGGANGETWGMTLMFAALLLGTKLAATRKRSASKAK